MPRSCHFTTIVVNKISSHFYTLKANYQTTHFQTQSDFLYNLSIKLRKRSHFGNPFLCLPSSHKQFLGIIYMKQEREVELDWMLAKSPTPTWLETHRRHCFVPNFHGVHHISASHIEPANTAILIIIFINITLSWS